MSRAHVIKAGDDDDDQREDLGCGEDVLELGGPFDVGAVDPSEETW